MISTKSPRQFQDKKRKPLSKKTRFEVFKRDGFTCAYCGRTPPNVILHCDHIIAAANGGGDDIDNLITSCSCCNLGKGARELTAIPKTVSEKTEILKEREEQIVAFNKLAQEKQERIEESAWLIADGFNRHWADDEGKFNRKWFSSLMHFSNYLSLDELLDSASIATQKFPHAKTRCFKYFCGICWRKIRGPKDEH